MNSSVTLEWKAVCKVDEILPGTGVGVRLPEGQAALFRTRDGQLHALDNMDPFSRANVISRGLLGSLGGPEWWRHRCINSTSVWKPGSAWRTRRYP